MLAMNLTFNKRSLNMVLLTNCSVLALMMREMIILVVIILTAVILGAITLSTIQRATTTTLVTTLSTIIPVVNPVIILVVIIPVAHAQRMNSQELFPVSWMAAGWVLEPSRHRIVKDMCPIHNVSVQFKLRKLWMLAMTLSSKRSLSLVLLTNCSVLALVMRGESPMDIILTAVIQRAITQSMTVILLLLLVMTVRRDRLSRPLLNRRTTSATLHHCPASILQPFPIPVSEHRNSLLMVESTALRLSPILCS